MERLTISKYFVTFFVCHKLNLLEDRTSTNWNWKGDSLRLLFRSHEATFLSSIYYLITCAGSKILLFVIMIAYLDRLIDRGDSLLGFTAFTSVTKNW